MSVLKVIHDGSEIQVPGTRRGEPLMRAISQRQIDHESGLGLAFSWVSANDDLAITVTRILVRNTSDEFLVMSDITALPANVACIYSIRTGNSTTTLAGGAAIVAKNLNRQFSSKVFDYDALNGETAIADADQVDAIGCSIVASNTKALSGIILGKNDFIQVQYDTETTSGRIILKGFFIPELI